MGVFARLQVLVSDIDHDRSPPGGTTACVTAGRLAAADPSLKILILEAGPHTRELSRHTQPALYLNNLASPETFTFHVGKPSASLDGRAAIVPSARCLGGGSSVNGTIFYVDYVEQIISPGMHH